ncbi:serine/threonine protein kinase [candidate division KSB1 bacterium]|nr:serine/threonine protein kinase [candidate division KSB1 bacterium]
MADNLLGSELGNGRFKIIGDRPLGKGGFATVYLGIQRPLNRKVAIKVLSTSAAEDEELVKRFIREARVMAMFDHPNIIKVIDSGSENGIHYFVMNYMPTSLRTILQLPENKNGLPVDQWLKIANDLASALNYIYQHSTVKEFVHRDIKPGNIMFDESDNAILTDFGLVKGEQFSQLTLKDTVMGTPKYMSPEQVKGEKLDHRSDLYSLGVVLFEMLVGRPPFIGEPLTICHKQVADPPPFPHEFKEQIPKRIEQIVLKLLEKNPDKRIQTAEELLDAFEDLENISRSGHTSKKTRLIVPKTATDTIFPAAESSPSKMQPTYRSPKHVEKTRSYEDFSTEKTSKPFYQNPYFLWSTILILVGLIGITAYQLIAPEIPVITDSALIKMVSIPPDALIIINNAQTNKKTPAELAVPPGDSIKIQFSLENYQSHIQKIYIARAETIIVKAKLQPIVEPALESPDRQPDKSTEDITAKLGNLQINSIPAGANIYKNGRKLSQQTPATLNNLPAGETEIGLQLAGYDDWKQSIIIRQGKTENISATLKKIETSVAGNKPSAMGEVSIVSIPTWGVICIEGVSDSMGTTPMVFKLEARDKPYRITIKRFNHEVVEGFQEIVVTPGSSRHLTFNLREKK